MDLPQSKLVEHMNRMWGNKLHAREEERLVARLPDSTDKIFKRPGLMRVSSEALREAPMMVMQLLSRMLIIEVHHDIFSERFDYLGYSLLFEEEGFMFPPPEYRPVFVSNASGNAELVRIERV